MGSGPSTITDEKEYFSKEIAEPSKNNSMIISNQPEIDRWDDLEDRAIPDDKIESDFYKRFNQEINNFWKETGKEEEVKRHKEEEVKRFEEVKTTFETKKEEELSKIREAQQIQVQAMIKEKQIEKEEIEIKQQLEEEIKKDEHLEVINEICKRILKEDEDDPPKQANQEEKKIRGQMKINMKKEEVRKQVNHKRIVQDSQVIDVIQVREERRVMEREVWMNFEANMIEEEKEIPIPWNEEEAKKELEMIRETLLQMKQLKESEGEKSEEITKAINKINQTLDKKEMIQEKEPQPAFDKKEPEKPASDKKKLIIPVFIPEEFPEYVPIKKEFLKHAPIEEELPKSAFKGKDFLNVEVPAEDNIGPEKDNDSQTVVIEPNKGLFKSSSEIEIEEEKEIDAQNSFERRVQGCSTRMFADAYRGLDCL